MSTKSPKPWKMFLPLAAVVALALLWSSYWFVAMATIKGEVVKQRSRLQQDGFDLNCQIETWGGFPFRFEYTCSAPKLSYASAIEASATALHAVAMAYKPWHVLVFADGPTTLLPPNQPAVTVRHASAQASIVATSTQTAQVTIDLRTVDVDGQARVNRALLNFRQRGPNTLDYAVEFDGLNLLLSEGRTIALDSFNIMGVLEDQNNLEIETIAASAGDVTIHGSGAIKREPGHPPKGQLALATTDVKALMDHLAKSLPMTAQEVAALTALLTMTGGKLVLVAADGQLFAGPLKIADLPELP